MMMKPRRDSSDKRGVRRAVVLMPNGLTLFNLFCGIYAIILAIRGDLKSAPSFIVLGGIADVLDGRVARATGTGSRFGEELDSLVDAISFGFAPALIMYLGLPKGGNWEWLLVFIFTSCAVMRLARFNVEQAGRKKTHFHGLPSPAAGLTLATYYWFSQTPLYNQTVILFTDSKTLSDLPWHTILRGLMAILAALMISDVPYPAVPSIGFDSVRKIIGTLVVAGCVTLLLVRREEFIFPALLAYVLYGAIKWAVLGFVGRSSTPGEIFWDERGQRAAREERRAARQTPVTPVVAIVPTSVAEAAIDDEDEPVAVAQHKNPRRKRRRRGRGPRPDGSPPPGPRLPDSPTGPSE
jgi:CDP-diacylglycerol--serine O-phosphatidyltransferase